MKRYYFCLLALFSSAVYSQNDNQRIFHVDKNGILPKPVKAQEINYISFRGRNIKVKFNDKTDTLGKIVVLTHAEVEKQIVNSVVHAKGSNLAQRYFFAAKEGLAFGKMDFALWVGSKCDNKSMRSLIFWEGKFYNFLDFGNYMWGAAMARLGFSYTEIKIGSECNAFLNTYTQNKDLTDKPWHGLCLSGDSKEDQAAIEDGFYGSLGIKSENVKCDTVQDGSFDSVKEFSNSILKVIWGESQRANRN